MPATIVTYQPQTNWKKKPVEAIKSSQSTNGDESVFRGYRSPARELLCLARDSPLKMVHVNENLSLRAHVRYGLAG